MSFKLKPSNSVEVHVDRYSAAPNEGELKISIEKRKLLFYFKNSRIFFGILRNYLRS